VCLNYENWFRRFKAASVQKYWLCLLGRRVQKLSDDGYHRWLAAVWYKVSNCSADHTKQHQTCTPTRRYPHQLLQLKLQANAQRSENVSSASPRDERLSLRHFTAAL